MEFKFLNEGDKSEIKVGDRLLIKWGTCLNVFDRRPVYEVTVVEIGRDYVKLSEAGKPETGWETPDDFEIAERLGG
jgi:hypothetical protein